MYASNPFLSLKNILVCVWKVYGNRKERHRPWKILKEKKGKKKKRKEKKKKDTAWKTTIFAFPCRHKWQQKD